MNNDRVITDDKTTTSINQPTVNNEITSFNNPTLNNPNNSIQPSVDLLKQTQNGLEVEIDTLKFKRFQLLTELEDVEKQLKPLIKKHKDVIKQIYIDEGKVTICPDYSRGKIESISSECEIKKVERKKEIKTMNFEQMVKSAQTLSEFDKVKLLKTLADLKIKLN